ncbi:dihydrofolate reductase [Cohnella endophytica]|uniref:Dihydrofolate reductase n=1 Tax=Cohnella endophytica TaxID=2419778 RepID=A0A494XAV6_9BACL|nr:dihydrofolate reductase family protein [Cohnella endophytica]RKP47957.1 dihydrofolate reductase [Cohnella endophytica]
MSVSTRKIVAGLFVSLDGIADAPEISPHEWTNDELMGRIAAGVAQADAVLLGSRTYSLLARFWKHQSDDIPMAKFLNGSPKYVVSSSPDALEWQPATLIQGNLFEELAKLKSQPGRNIQIPGSPTLVRSLLREGLLDELTLNICPVVVGSGLRLFDEIADPVRLKLVDSVVYGNGVIGVTYSLSLN